MEVMLKIIPCLRTRNVAKHTLDTLIDFTLRVEEIRDTAIEFGIKLLYQLDQGEISFKSLSQSPFLIE